MCGVSSVPSFLLGGRNRGSGIVLWSWSLNRDCEEGIRLCKRGALRLEGSSDMATSAALVDEWDLAGDFDRLEMADGEMLESERKWPKVGRGDGLGFRCCDQAAT